jgi:predicted amidohydrolase YtcJ
MSVSLAVALAAACADETPFDSLQGTGVFVLYGGNVITMDPVSRVEEAILVRDGVVVAAGSSAEIRGMMAPSDVGVDLGGRTVMPGFVDPHNHSYNAIYNGTHADLVGTTYDDAQEALLEVGTTAIGNPGVWPEAADDFLSYAASSGLRLRTTLYLGYNSNCGIAHIEDWYLSHPRIADPRAMLRIPGIKFFTDGGSCNPSANSWADDPEALLYMSAEELAAAVTAVQGHGYQAAIHALGDVALDVALDALSIVQAGGSSIYRYRIEHARIIRPEQLPRFGEVGAIPVVYGLPYTCRIVDGASWARLENDPTAFYVRPWFFPHRALLDANPRLPVAWKSDGPEFYWPNDPIPHLWALVTRDEARDDGSLCDAPAWLEAGGVSIEEALEMMTIDAAYALGMDEAIGSLRPGKLADLVILSDNPLTVDPSDLGSLEVLVTMVGGEIEYCSPGHERLCPVPAS